ncbi:MAG: polysaccharide deacetylase [Betaproteobacteria bacterium]|jgi:allantoinase|nr:polysaccharide deacetylase [Candidatus Fonsibacter lacus]
MHLTDRAPYQALPDRPVLQGLDGARLLVWVIVNVEHWRIDGPMPRTVLSPPMGQPLQPDLPNWAWHEYGMRSGFWRLHQALSTRGMVPTLAINGRVCDTYPRVAEAALKAGWEFMGHGLVQGPTHHVADQAEAVAQTMETIRRFTGAAPRGWESPGLTETDTTLDVLSAAGVDYVADWVLDDLPTWLHATPRPMLSVPYTVEINDIPLMAIQHHTGDELLHRGRKQLERLAQESLQQPRVMAISVHPYITGVPHRIGAFEQLLDAVLHTPQARCVPGVAIADWYAAQVPAPAAAV